MPRRGRTRSPAWTYSWSPNNDSTGTAVKNISGDAGSTGGVSFTLEGSKLATGSSDIVATNLRIFSSADATNPDQMGKDPVNNPTGGMYSLTLTLTDTASGQTGTALFKGQLTGSFSLYNSNLSNQFFNTLDSPTTQTLLLGINTYTVTLQSYSFPGPPTASNAGSIGAHVTVNGGVGSIAETPEPTSLMLSCLGLTVLGAVRARSAAR